MIKGTIALSNFKNNFLWNAIGAGFNAGNSVLFLIIVTRVLGIHDAGYFSLAFTTSVLLANIGLYNMRSYQITDIQHEYLDFEYLSSRTVTSIIMLIAFLLYAMTKYQNKTMFYTIILLGLWRIPEVFADAMHGTLQMNDRLDLAGKSIFLKALSCLVIFAAVIYFMKDVILASIAILMVNMIVFGIYDIKNYKKCGNNFKIRINYKVLGLLVTCLPLLFIALLYSYLLNAPKYFIDHFSSPENQAIFAIIITPSSIIWLLFNLVFSPLLPSLSVLYHEKDKRKFYKRLRWMLLIIVIVSVLFLFFMDLIGIRILEIIYRTPLAAYRLHFMIAGAGTGLLSIASVFSYMVIIQRKNQQLLASYLVITVISYFSTGYLVRTYDLFGATLSYTLIMILLAIILLSVFLYLDRKNRKKVNP